MKIKSFLSRTARFESLEVRSMLSVTASVSAGVLGILGTSANESVQAYQSGAKWIVQGIGGTKVNNSTAPQSFTGVDQMVVNLGAGNDFVHVFNGTLSGTMEVFYNSEADTGIKTTQLINLTVGVLDVIDEGNGANSIVASKIQTTDEGASFDTSNGNDVIALSNMKLAGTLGVSAQNGRNVITETNIQTSGGGIDLIETGTGKDVISVSQYSSSNGLQIEAGGGGDTVAMNQVNIGESSLLVELGPAAGNNATLVINNSTAGSTELFDLNGTNGILSGVKNHFGSLFVDSNFTHRYGQFA